RGGGGLAPPPPCAARRLLHHGIAPPHARRRLPIKPSASGTAQRRRSTAPPRQRSSRPESIHPEGETRPVFRSRRRVTTACSLARPSLTPLAAAPVSSVGRRTSRASEDAVAPLHADRPVLVGVVLELAHRSLRCWCVSSPGNGGGPANGSARDRCSRSRMTGPRSLPPSSGIGSYCLRSLRDRGPSDPTARAYNRDARG